MAQASFKTRVLVDSLNLSCEARSVNFAANVDTYDVSTICDESKVFITGEDTSTFSADGPLDVDSSTNEPYDVLTSFKASTAKPITYAPSGLSTGSETVLLDALETNYGTSASTGSTVDFSLSAITTGDTDFGESLEDLTAVTADGNGTARDLTAASSNGGVAHLHVTAFTGLTSNDITIEQSADGSTGWTTLVTFAQVTGVTSERVVVAAGTSVARYLRVVDDVTGSGSCTRQVSFARR